MELVQNKEELRSLSPDEIFKRLSNAYREMCHSTKRLTESESAQVIDEFASSEDLFSINAERLTLEEIKSVDMYLSAGLAIMKNRLKQVKHKVCASDGDAIVAGFDILTSAKVYKRAYQKALMMWIGRRNEVQQHLRPLPKELGDRDIPFSLSLAIGTRFRDVLSSITNLLEEVIAEATAFDDERMGKKARGLLSIVNNALTDYEKNRESMRRDERFLLELSELLKSKGTYGKVIMRADHIELNPHLQVTYPFIQKDHPCWEVEPGEKMVLNSRFPLSVLTREIAERLGLNSDTEELRPVTSTTEEHYIRIDFTWVKKE